MTAISHRVSSTEYKHEDTCNLFNPHHSIPEDVAEVLEAFNELEGHRAVAAGCNTCSAHALNQEEGVEAFVYYVAQNDSDAVYFGYGGTDAKAVAYTLIGLAEELDVSHEWNGETSQKVLLGD